MTRMFFANRISATLSILSLSALIMKAGLDVIKVWNEQQFEWLKLAPPMIPLFIVLAVVGGLTFYVVRSGQRTQVFLLLSAYQDNPYYMDLLGHLCNQFQDSEYDVIVKMPDQRHQRRRAQLSILKTEIVPNSKRYSAGFIVPVPDPEEELSDELQSCCMKFRKPIVFIDLDPFGVQEFGTEALQFCGFVGFAGEAGGDMASKYAIEQLERDKTRLEALLESDEWGRLAIVILSNGNVQRTRRTKFREDVVGHATMLFGADKIQEVSADGEDSQRGATAALMEFATNNSDSFPVIIYSVQDQMTLGASRAVQAVQRYRDSVLQPVVIGFDGIREVRQAIEDGDGPIRAAVVQDPKALAEMAFSLYEDLRAMTAPRSAQQRYVALTPEFYQSDGEAP